MFAGNAKTHFQIIGKDDKSDGYMMSPFGDERWDVDDKEKLRKIYKKPEEGNYPFQSHERGYHSQHQMPTSVNVNAPMPSYQSNWGYNQHSEPLMPQNYAPKYQSYSNQVPHQVQSAQNYYYDQINTVPQYQQPVQVPQGAWSCSNIQQTPVSNTSRMPVTRRNNGLNYDDVKQRPKSMYCQPNYQKIEKQNVQSSQGLQNLNCQPVCDQCCGYYGNNKNSNQILEKNWKVSSHVPLLIAGETGYKPLGPTEATPNPFFPAREKTMYAPL